MHTLHVFWYENSKIIINGDTLGKIETKRVHLYEYIYDYLWFY